MFSFSVLVLWLFFSIQVGTLILIWIQFCKKDYVWYIVLFFSLGSTYNNCRRFNPFYVQNFPQITNLCQPSLFTHDNEGDWLTFFSHEFWAFKEGTMWPKAVSFRTKKIALYCRSTKVNTAHTCTLNDQNISKAIYLRGTSAYFPHHHALM